MQFGAGGRRLGGSQEHPLPSLGAVGVGLGEGEGDGAGRLGFVGFSQGDPAGVEGGLDRFTAYAFSEFQPHLAGADDELTRLGGLEIEFAEDFVAVGGIPVSGDGLAGLIEQSDEVAGLIEERQEDFVQGAGEVGVGFDADDLIEAVSEDSAEAQLAV